MIADAANRFTAHKSPTCYVLDKFQITDEGQRNAVWMWSGLMADDLWHRVSVHDPKYQARGRHVVGLVIAAFDGQIPHAIRDALRASLQSAIAFCLDSTL